MKSNEKNINNRNDNLNNLDDTQQKIYKISNIISKEIIVLSIILIIIGCIFIISDLSNKGIWYGLATVLIIMTFLFISLPLILFYLGIRNSKKYLMNNNIKALKKAKIFDILSLIISIIYMTFLLTDLLSLEELGLALIIGYTALIIIPNIIHISLCFNLKVKKWILSILIIMITPIIIFRLSILSPNKIKVNFDNLPTITDFNNELIRRKILPESYYMGINNSYSYIEKYYESNWENGFYYAKAGEENEKATMYRYARYEININGVDFDWELYSINNKMYAYLDYIWKNETTIKNYNLSKGIVVSEEDKITTYNDKDKYYSYGGGIIRNFSSIKKALYGKHITEVSFENLYMVDKYNSNCANIVVVKEINEESLKNISNKIMNGEYY